jgi:hypothetical protein
VAGIKIGFGGIPTDIDVRRLLDRFGVPKPGTIITYKEIGAVLKLSHKDSRFWSVTCAWRNQLWRQNNRVSSAIPNEAFEFLDSHQRVAFTEKKAKEGIRKVVKASQIAVATDRSELSSDEIKTLDHIAFLGPAFKLAEATKARELIYDDPVKET